MPPLHAKESKALLDSGFHALNSGFPCTVHVFCWWNLLSGFQSLVVFCRIPQEKFCRISDSTGKNQKGRNPDSYTWRGDTFYSMQQHLKETSLKEMINTSVLDEDQP